jgi:hypothetical protein
MRSSKLKNTTVQHILFFFRWFLGYNASLVWLQAKTPELPEQPNKHVARALDIRRKKAQMQIFDIVDDYSYICGSCGRCCVAKVERYTAFDQFIHKGTGEPLHHYDSTILRLPWMIKNGLKNTASRLLNRKDSSKEFCRYLDESGCTLPLEKRPLLCASWFCPKYIFTMHPTSLNDLDKHLAEMKSIHYEIAHTISQKKRA